MGAQTSRISAITLNYSGIYLSPFEYYGIDNWQELEKIGRIFEEELKKDYQGIQDRTKLLNQEEPKQKKKEQDDIKKKKDLPKDYMRKEFAWAVGQIDKKLHVQRFTPIYISKIDLENQVFAGVRVSQNDSKQVFMSEIEFEKEWNNVFHSLTQSKDTTIKKAANEASPLDKYNCCKFDFMCFKSIALYVNHEHNNNEGKILNFREATYWDYEALARESTGKKDVIFKYKKLMAQYFSLIHIKAKIDLTVKWLFQKNSPELISFTEGTPDLRDRLVGIEGYHMFGPSESKQKKQTIIMVKKTLPFIQKDATIQKLKKLDGDAAIKQELLTELGNYSQKLKNYWENTLKGNLTKKEQENGDTWIRNLLGGFLFWMEDITFHRFSDSDSDKKQKVIIGGFHLSSKTAEGQLSGQLLGLIIYHLVKKDYKFVFSGDFNSYITLREKDEQLGVFAFIKAIYPQQVESIIKNVRIYPKHPRILTTKKKRTMLQVQTRKVNELAQKCIDQVITNYPIDYDQSHVGEIKDTGIAKNNYDSFLPHKEHPYDHFVVEAILDLKVVQDLKESQ